MRCDVSQSAYDVDVYLCLCCQDTAQREGDGASAPPHVLREAVSGAQPSESGEVSPNLPQRNATQDRVRDAQKPS